MKKEVEEQLNLAKAQIQAKLDQLEKEAKGKLDEFQTLAKVKLEEAKRELEDLKGVAEDVIENKIIQTKAQYQTIEDELEARYKGILAKVRLFIRLLLSKIGL